MHKATIQLLEKTISVLGRELERSEQSVALAGDELNRQRREHAETLARYEALKSDLADAMAMTVRDGAVAHADTPIGRGGGGAAQARAIPRHDD